MRYAIGIDLGGTKIEAALVDEEGNRLDSHRLPTNSEEGAAGILRNLNKAIETVRTREIEGIGIGTPGFIHNNVMTSNPNVPGLGDAIETLQKEFPGIKFENDANCFALAEHKWGVGKNRKHMLGIIWGTGIGCGIIIDGKLVHGAIGGAGEVGHIVMDRNIQDYSLGGPSTWEHVCSGPNIVRRYHDAGGDQELKRPDDIWANGGHKGKKNKEETLQYMGMGLGSMASIFNPEIIVMGGGVSNIYVYEELNEQMKKYTNHLTGDSCSIVKNSLGDSAGVLGAAALVFK